MSACTLCGGEIIDVRERREFRVRGRSVTVDVEFSRCVNCGEEMWSGEQVTAAQLAVAETIRRARNLLQPSEIVRIRRSLGLTQDEFEQLLGAGKKTVVRWERGIVPPSSAMNELIWLIGEDRKNAERLAVKNGVA
ncbi:MAG: type II TA system antitoxin MqsA family protein [Longimicrobiaceae bacterium]